MIKEYKIAAFDPNQPAQTDANLFGLPFSAEESDIIIIPVPWEVTVSYGSGASEGPVAVFNASLQVDLLHQEFPDLWKLGIYLDEPPGRWADDGASYKLKANSIIQALEEGNCMNEYPELLANLEAVNHACSQLNVEVFERTKYWFSKGKKVILLGGDHSTPLGYYEGLASQYESFGILHLDAHMDLREAYEGFTYSHASIMYNTLKIPNVSKLVQVGIRDFCEEEMLEVKKQSSRVAVFTDRDMKAKAFEGVNWREQCDEIIKLLPQKVCVSFDIDALMPVYCPNTGTPVPGGLSFEQATYLLSRLARSGRKIIGVDLVEIAPGNDDWDGNVGARILFHLCGVLAKSQNMDVGEGISFRG